MGARSYFYKSNKMKTRMKLFIGGIAIILLGVLSGCDAHKQAKDELIVVDVSKSYPKKDLILQDFMDVEYVALETSDEFLTQGLVQAVGKDFFIVTNRNSDGEIYFFDRKTGKGIRKINRKGQGAEEYARINSIVLDESNGELLVQSPGNKILVYDLDGKFKRCLNLGREVSSIFDYDKQNLIGYDMSDYYNKGKDRTKPYHVLISKLDGKTTREILIPFKTINTPIVVDGERFVANFYSQISLSNGQWTLMDASSDTLYNYTQDGGLKPLIVRTPSTHTMKPELFLYLGICTDRYCFMQTSENKFDFEKGSGFNTNELMYDKDEKAVYQATVLNKDYLEKRPVAMTAKSINRDIEGVTSLNAPMLVELYQKGQLRDGKLKEIASKLNEEDNPVIMLMKRKNNNTTK